MFREVPGSLWKYPEGYGTLQDAETEARPSWKVHKVVGRWEKDFPWGQGGTPRSLAFPPGRQSPRRFVLESGLDSSWWPKPTLGRTLAQVATPGFHLYIQEQGQPQNYTRKSPRLP